MNSSKRRIFSNVSWNTTTFVLQTLVFILATPVFVRGLGIEGFGIWTLISTFVGFNGVAGMGLTDATIKFVSQYRARGDVRAIRDTISTAIGIYLVMGVLLSLAVMLASSAIMGPFFGIRSEHAPEAALALQVGALGFLFKLFDAFFGSVMQAYQRYDRISQIDLAVVIGMTGTQAVIVSLGYGFVSFVVVMVAASFIGMLLKFVAAKNMLGMPGAFFPRFAGDQFRALFNFGFFTWLQALNGIIFGQVDRLLVASLLGAEALGYYAVCSRAAAMIQLIPARATSFLFPLVAYQHEKGDLSVMRKVYFVAQNLTMASAVALGIPLVLFAHSILSLWIDPVFASKSALLLQVLTITAGSLATTILPYYYLNGTGFVRLNTLFGWMVSAVTVIALVLLAPKYGVVGAAMSRLAAHSVLLVCYPILHRAVFHDRRIYVGVLVMLPVLVGLGGAWLGSFYIYQPSSLAGMVLSGIAWFVVGILLMVPLSFVLNPPFGVDMREVLGSIFQSLSGLRKRLYAK